MQVWRLAKGTVPPGGLDLFRLAALGAAPGGNPADVTCVVLRLSNDAMLGSSDDVP